jgi:D-cysteine desulfhydrase
MKTPQKISLAHIPTPIEEISFENKKFLIKRDDYTGSDFLGNKIRKLEYLLYEAKNIKAGYIFTCGGDQSNHARATASAAVKLGFKVRLYLWGSPLGKKDGNLFLDNMYGAEIVYLNKKEFDNVDEIMFEDRKKLLKKRKEVYVIPAGGTSVLGIWGYISFIKELKKQIDLKKVDGIFAACGSGGTAAGLLVGCALYNVDLNIYSVNVLHTESEIRKKILQIAEAARLEFGIKNKINPSLLKIIDGYSKEGYKSITKSKLKLISKFSRSTGILLDPAYTGKAFVAYYEKFLKSDKGRKIIFLHTGGIFGAFPKKEDYLKHS